MLVMIPIFAAATSRRGSAETVSARSAMPYTPSSRLDTYDQHRGAEPLVKIADQAQDFLPSLCIEVSCRLVGQQDGRVHR